MTSCADDKRVGDGLVSNPPPPPKVLFLFSSVVSSRSKMSKMLHFCFLYCRLVIPELLIFFHLIVSSFVRHIPELSLFDRFLWLQVSDFMSAEWKTLKDF